MVKNSLKNRLKCSNRRKYKEIRKTLSSVLVLFFEKNMSIQSNMFMETKKKNKKIEHLKGKDDTYKNSTS
jgi:hypothetical protein